MRRGNQERRIIRNDAGELVAINFGFDFCCEHECGPDQFYKALGITGPTKKVQGVEARRIRTWDANACVLKEYSKDTVLVWGGFLKYTRTEEERMERLKEVPRELAAPTWAKAAKEDLEWSSAWTSGPGSPDFGLRFRKGADSVLFELKEALEREDVSLWTNAGGFGGRGGLVLAITSKIPEAVNDTMVEADLDALRLAKAADKTKIKIKLDKASAHSINEGARAYDAKFRYFALSPSWIDAPGKESKHPVMFWLNPMNQQENNYGWFTVEELEQWIKGEGPIPKERGRSMRKEVRY